jgi:hypothetical protein
VKLIWERIAGDLLRILSLRGAERYQNVLGLNVETAWTAGTVFCGALVLNDVDLNVVRDRRCPLQPPGDEETVRGNRTNTHGIAQETGNALPGSGQPQQSGLRYWDWGLLAREQRDRNTEREKLAAALDIFTELNMPRERDTIRAELEKTTGADRAT